MLVDALIGATDPDVAALAQFGIPLCTYGVMMYWECTLTVSRVAVGVVAQVHQRPPWLG